MLNPKIKHSAFYLSILGMCLAMLGGIGFYAIVSPAFLTADEVLHVDYAYQVSKGDLPDFNKGPVAPPDVKKPKLQFVSQHPPLYYLIISPIVGSQIDSGHTVRGVYLARLATILLSILCALAFAWAGWELAENNKELFAISVAGVATSLVPFVLFAGAVYNDVLGVLFTTLAMAMIIRIIKNGISWKSTGILGIISALGMAARASSVNIVGLSMLFIFISAFIHRDVAVSKTKTAITAMLHASFIPISVLVIIGWFYIRNRQMSGSFSRSASQDWAKSLGRKYKTRSRVLTTPKLWTMIFTDQYGRAWKKIPAINSLFSISMLSFFTLLSFVRAIREKVFKKMSSVSISILTLFILAIILSYGQQVSHAVGYGAYNVRYLLPMQLPLALLLTYGIFQLKAAKGLVVSLFLAINWSFVIATTLYLYASRRTSLTSIRDVRTLFNLILDKSNFDALIYMSLVILVIGFAIQSLGIYRLSKQASKARIS